MNQEIETILADVWAAAPELREREGEIRQVVQTLLTNRPSAELDDQFRAELRAKLIEQFKTSEAKPQFAFRLPIWSRYLASATAGGVFVAVTLAFTLVSSLNGPSSVMQYAATDQTKPGSALGSITRLAAGAFGSLNEQATLGTNQPTAAAAPASGIGARAGGGGGFGTPATEASVDMKMMPPYYQAIRQEYVFEGDLPLPGAPVSVIKAEPTFDDSAITAVLGRSKLGPLDLRQLSQMKIDSLTLSEDREWGYSVMLNTSDGGLYINQNWSRWPNNNICSAGKPCEPPAPLTVEQLPSNETFIAIAEKFLSDYGLNRNNYGMPTINDEWRIFYQQSVSQGYEYWIPDNHQVTFPMIVDGRPVYDESGNPQGLNVSVDARLLKVTNAGPFYLQRYLTSEYDAIGDADKVRAALKQGGLQAWSDPNTEKVVTHALNNPTEVLMLRYVWTGTESQRLFVPALMFPLANREAEMTPEYWLPRAIVLPLAAEFYTETAGGGIYPEPRPLIEPPVPMPAPESSVAPDVAQ